MRVKRSFPMTVHPDRAGEHFTVEKHGYPETPAFRAKTLFQRQMKRADAERMAALLPKLGPNERFLVQADSFAVDGVAWPSMRLGEPATTLVDRLRPANPGEYWKYEPAASATTE